VSSIWPINGSVHVAFYSPPCAIFAWRAGRPSDRNLPALLNVYLQNNTQTLHKYKNVQISSYSRYLPNFCQNFLEEARSPSSFASISRSPFSVYGLNNAYYRALLGLFIVILNNLANLWFCFLTVCCGL